MRFILYSVKNVSFYIGTKIVFPLQSRWTEKAEAAALSVYYPTYDNRVYESYPLAASRSFREERQGTVQLPPVQYLWQQTLPTRRYGLYEPYQTRTNY